MKQALRHVFPTIRWVGVRPSTAHVGQVEIVIWNVDPSSQRSDLAVLLSESGTGIGQVLAILYVVLASEANVIIIDEPNSFLHPGASRRLREILQSITSINI